MAGRLLFSLFFMFFIGGAFAAEKQNPNCHWTDALGVGADCPATHPYCNDTDLPSGMAQTKCYKKCPATMATTGGTWSNPAASTANFNNDCDYTVLTCNDGYERTGTSKANWSCSPCSITPAGGTVSWTQNTCNWSLQCAAGKYYRISDHSCQNCTPGHYCANPVNATNATAGDLGHYDCGAGYYCPNISTKENCGVGHCCPTANMTAPTNCVAGKYCSEPNRTDCSTATGNCAAGYFCQAGSINAQGDITGGTPGANKCAAGYYCPSGSENAQGKAGAVNSHQCGGDIYYCLAGSKDDHGRTIDANTEHKCPGGANTATITGIPKTVVDDADEITDCRITNGTHFIETERPVDATATPPIGPIIFGNTFFYRELP
ncbi:MAG: hypothetical protein LBO08_03435 [Rickettsiales bacterium]|nr:hypothetical protein [Rickettsiales bacterium]